MNSATHTYTASASADRQRAHVAESAYQALLSNIKSLSDHVAAVQLSSGVPDAVQKGLEETLEKAKRGWKKIKTERKRRKKKRHAMKERTMKQEDEHLFQQAAEAAVASAAAANTSHIAVVALPAAGAAAAGAATSSNILQALSASNEEGGRKRRQLPESSAADTTADDEAEEDEEDDEEAEGEGQDVSPPLAFASMPRLGVMSLTSPVPVPPNVTTTNSHTPNVAPTSLPPVPAAAYQSADGVSDAQAPVVMSCSKFPIAVLNVPVQRQYTMTRKDSKRMKRADKEALVNVTVRIMGTPDRQHIYFVAKDVCQLICLRKGSVAKAIHDFSSTEKARMPVLCQRSSGSGCTQVLTVLTMAGVQRLMTSSRQPIARSVLQWLSERVVEIQAGQMPSTAFDPNAVMQSADSSHTQITGPGQQLTAAGDTTSILFPPQSSSHLTAQAPSGLSLYQQYGLSDMAVDVPVSPQIGFAGTRPSLSIHNFPHYSLSSQPGAHSLTSVTQFANHAFLNPNSMSLPSFSPVSSFGSSTSSYSLPGVTQPPQQPTSLHSQPHLLPVGYPSILSQLIGSSPTTSAAFPAAHQPQPNSASHSLFMSGAGGIGLFPNLGGAGGSRHSTSQHQPGAAPPSVSSQSHFSQLLAAHQQQQQGSAQHPQQQQQQSLHQRLVDQHGSHLGSQGLSLSNPSPRPSLPSSSPHRPTTTSHPYLPASTTAPSPYNINTSSTHRGQLS